MMKDVVSVVIVTYNSEKTIVETLDSILNQRYGPSNIELIISDDASTDDTTIVVDNWITENISAFSNVIFKKNTINQGVSKNCNIGWKACSSEWIKTIGADDLLSDDCIDKNMEYIKNHPDCDIVFSQMKWFGRINKITPEPYNMPFFSLDAQQQYNYLRFKSFNFAPASFIRRSALIDVGYADERFSTIEDLPLWLRFTKRGYKLNFLKAITVYYRVANSASKHSHRYVNHNFLNDLINIDKMFKISNVEGVYYKALKLDTLTLLYGKKLIAKLTKNKVSYLSRSLDVIHLGLRPIYIIRKIRRHIINFTKKDAI
ncbi:glycosyltransferase family 2 protein [Cronobacter dublinensis]|uniref:glycosyltransferase family 2 protein n=1 Tax=Cronobacter dublinensis TaxID=413497 RepID=UPI00300E37E6